MSPIIQLGMRAVSVLILATMSATPVDDEGLPVRLSDRAGTLKATRGPNVPDVRHPYPRLCGGFLGLPCRDGEFCKLDVGLCCCDYFGICTDIPNACPDVWDPVCGCDGVTYGNECEADAAGVSIDRLGACEPFCRPTPDGSACTPLACSAIPEEQCIPTTLHLDIQTGAITVITCDCVDSNACHIEFGDASPFAVGYCPPVTGCEVIAEDSDGDGIDDLFSAACLPAAAGACCLDIDDGPVSYDTCTDADADSCGGVFHGVNTGCADVQACCLTFAGAGLCADLSPYCCEDSGGVPLGPGSTCASGGPAGGCGPFCGGIASIPCEDPDSYCNLGFGRCCCDQLGVCTPYPFACLDVVDPVCGCDGVTHPNACYAATMGESIDYVGECQP